MGDIMKKNKLVDESMAFAVAICTLCEHMKYSNSIKEQLLRSGTSIGANIREANYAHSRADFISKMQIALKECYETEYWLELFFRIHKISANCYHNYLDQCGSIRMMLIASINTAKGNEG
mgnify:CR=1 FL=1